MPPLAKEVEGALVFCRDQQSFFQELLRKTLNWPVGKAGQVEEIAYAWSAEDLKAANLDEHLIKGRAWQIQPLEHGQPWGIFVLEFKNPDALTARRGMAGVLRRMLRGLVSSRRKDAALPSWKRDHLLFICTHAWQSYRFAYFRSKFGDPRGSRLTTFGWGPGTSNRTVCEFSLPSLLWPPDNANPDKWVADWSKAFDKERLTNDFFKRFDDALEAVKRDLLEFQKLSSAEAYTQAQLLLERLIFLYFLQNRGWLSQDRRYLPQHLGEHISKPGGFSYYKEFLDKVFWTLSSAPGSGGRLPGIPFLNGGLFDDDEFAQPNDLRKTNPPLRVRNKTFQYAFQELLEAFNFTVTEDTPLNQEVAVDPEMLGKVFESIVLHAEEADPEATAPDKRKATGSYYTPRIVVHFICQEVLYQYLVSHLPALNGSKDGWSPKLRALLVVDASDGFDEEELEALKKTVTPEQAVQIRDLVVPLKCCDPAVGSGAFPVGLMHELVNLRRILETAANGYVDPHRGEGSTWLQKTKEDIVQNCLFGVDIQQQAIEICRLRLWLTLVVDYDLGVDPFQADKTQFNRAIEGISQLPNLEMNFHRGDSLHDHISGVPIVIMPEKASRYADDFRAIADKGEKLHRARKAELKRKLRIEILEKRLSLSQEIISEELKALDRDESALDKLFHDETETSATKRKRIAQEKERLAEALTKIERDREKLEKLTKREYDSQFYVQLRKLEGADFDSPFNFAWYIDFPGIFGGQDGTRGGFDVIVGNPPFVTARNPERRELWRQRWPRVCVGTYQLVCPFMEVAFSLLRPDGSLGYIVSNGFAKREFGKPLVEHLISQIALQKVVDCSGLLFPGHGTPTCLIFAANRPAVGTDPIRNVTILPGGGDLRTPPEESKLWETIEHNHNGNSLSLLGTGAQHISSAWGFRKLYEDLRIAVGDCDRQSMLTHPCRWCFVEWPTFEVISGAGVKPLRSFLKKDIGRMLATSANEIFIVPEHVVRAQGIEPSALVGITEGDEIRNWSVKEPQILLNPYEDGWKLSDLKRVPGLAHWFNSFRRILGNRTDFDGGTYDENRRPWYEFHQFDVDKAKAAVILGFPDVVTHAHFQPIKDGRLLKDHSPAIVLAGDSATCLLFSGLLNSSSVLFWLKQTCFNKGAGEDEERDRFEFQGTKVQQLPIPKLIADAVQLKMSGLADALIQLSKSCWERGQELSKLGLRKLLEKDGEAYWEWNVLMPGYLPPEPDFAMGFDSTSSLRKAYKEAQAVREGARAEMIARQEEMDWLVYVVYGLLSQDHVAAQVDVEPAPLDREERPFHLWMRAEGNFARSVQLIPYNWTAPRKRLWEGRLAAIRDNEHIRRIEQPVYKRRWDEQWKVGSGWQCGPIAYAAEFVEAFEWWLREKAEWWLEKKKNGGPVEFDEWAQILWKDTRIRAAWPVAADEYSKLEYEKMRANAEENGEPAPTPPKPNTDFSGFRREYKRIVDEETVPGGIPFGGAYEDVEKKLKWKIPGTVRKVRGKLNVPRERFHLHDKTQYLWAGLQFR